MCVFSAAAYQHALFSASSSPFFLFLFCLFGNGRERKEARIAAKKGTSRSSKVGRQFPVSRILQFLKAGKYAERVGVSTPVYLTAILEYLVAEVLKFEGNATRDKKKTRIMLGHIQLSELSVRNDNELTKLLGSMTISSGDMMPNIHNLLLPKKASKPSGAGDES